MARCGNLENLGNLFSALTPESNSIFGNGENNIPPAGGSRDEVHEVHEVPAAIQVLREAKALGVQLSLRRDLIDWCAASPPPSGFIARLRAAKPELIELLSGDACRICGELIDWSVPGARAFADDTAAHNGCWEEAEIDRHLRNAELAVASPAALADDNEVMVKGLAP